MLATYRRSLQCLLSGTAIIFWNNTHERKMTMRPTQNLEGSVRSGDEIAVPREPDLIEAGLN